MGRIHGQDSPIEEFPDIDYAAIQDIATSHKERLPSKSIAQHQNIGRIKARKIAIAKAAGSLQRDIIVYALDRRPIGTHRCQD